MKYTVNINQKAVCDAGFDLDLTDMAIFDVLTVFVNSTACRRMNDGECTYFNVPYQVVIDELPLAKITKPDSVYRRFQKLEIYSVIEMHPDNKKMKQVWFRWGRNYGLLHSDSMTGSKSGQPEKKMVRPDQNPVQTGSKSVLRPDENPTYHNTSHYAILSESVHAHDAESSPLKAEDKKNPLPSSAAPSPYSPPNVDDEINAMLVDDLCGERFFRQCRIPIEQFRTYAENFRLKLKSEQATHANRRDLRSHFFSWASLEFAREQKQNNGHAKLTFHSPDTIREGLDFAERFASERRAGKI